MGDSMKSDGEFLGNQPDTSQKERIRRMAQEENKSGYFKGLSRQDYIKKTHEIMKKEGIEAVSIRRIAAELGCSSASLYRHFKNREELLYYAELRTLKSYIDSLNRAERTWSNMWDIYVGIWDCYAREAFTYPEAYNLLFFIYSNKKLNKAIREYYEIFPEDLKHTNRFFQEMLKTPDFMSRDFEMCKKCINDGAVTYENAIRLNRMVCMLFAGYFKKVLDEGIEEYQIGERVDQFIKDLDTIVKALAKDLKGYTGYKNRIH